MNPILKLENVEKYYGSKFFVSKAVDGISFSVNEGEFAAIMGASGSGKTTLLNLISAIDRVTGGKITLDGQDVTRLKGRQAERLRRQKLGFIFQDFNLLDTMTGYENIALALSIQGIGAVAAQKRIREVAEDLGISGALDKYPYRMSGGQRQRIARARAIVTKPKIILADEPTGSLDSKSGAMLLESLSFLNKSYNATIIMVTHDAFAASYAERVLFIKDGRLFDEIYKGNNRRKDFFDSIVGVITLLGGTADESF